MNRNLFFLSLLMFLFQSAFALPETQKGYKNLVDKALFEAQEKVMHMGLEKLISLQADEESYERKLKEAFSPKDYDFLKEKLTYSVMKDASFRREGTKIVVTYKSISKTIGFERLLAGSLHIDGKDYEISKKKTTKEIFNDLQQLLDHEKVSSFNPFSLLIGEAHAVIDPISIIAIISVALIAAVAGLFGSLVWKSHANLKKELGNFQGAVGTCKNDLEILKNSSSGVIQPTETIQFMENLIPKEDSDFRKIDQKPLSCESIMRYTRGMGFADVRQLCHVGLELAECLEETQTVASTKNINVNRSSSRKEIESSGYQRILQGVRSSRQ